ncbi:hypothetical protein BS50DRAFT_610033 [Corynespora cassiicola Philippines]|uniref:P-loop containing nucleoside triphosphate hydrolase protein n=1 Tax=Corynespora cassiicola Philippines TaxID=1448308 RepID=A0A2T2NSM6_CORCC|nr:hypothetical protein BS50DRAFT_610033 [Corynespora cassiicola Philippines]
MASPRTFAVSVSPQAKASYLALASIASIARRRAFSTRGAHRDSGQYSRSDFTNQPFTGGYDPDEPTRGPLADASIVGASHITPKKLKEHLDKFVVGQDRAKVVLSVAVHEHYLRLRELERQEEEQMRLEAQAQRKAMAHRHQVEDEYPGQLATVTVYSPPSQTRTSFPPENPDVLQDTSPLQIEKSNVLVLGPTGVGKTLMTKTLARVLDVPISASDCTPFTQAGYIGEDAEVCVHRLLAAANYDIAAAERGIIILDEFDKIATAKVSHGKDVSGEGVQQALLKIIEGTTVQIQPKSEKSAGRNTGNPMDGMPPKGPGSGNGGKNEVYNVRTDNILFICTGAFVGLHKMVLDRMARGGMGFNATVRASNPETGSHETTLSAKDAALFKGNLPYYFEEELEAPHVFSNEAPKEVTYNMLDFVEPTDLQKYGMIPELVGRVPTTCAVSALDEDALVKVLTEPRNSLVRQVEQLFHLNGTELRFTRGALKEIAKKAVKMGTGARGLKTIVDRLLLQTKYKTPGSTIKYILVNQAAAQLKSGPLYFDRERKRDFLIRLAKEEDEWEQELYKEEDPAPHVNSFEEYRKAGVGAY